MLIQTVRLVNSCFNLELDCKKAGRTNNRTPIIYTKVISRSINSLNYLITFLNILCCPHWLKIGDSYRYRRRKISRSSELHRFFKTKS